MKYPTLILSCFLCFTLTLPACQLISSNNDDSDQSTDPIDRRQLPRSLNSQEIQVVQGSGSFGLNLMQRLMSSDSSANHLISPMSIVMAFGMAMNGAEGETYRQMKETFGLQDMSREEMNQSARELIELLSGFDEKVEFNVANSIWTRDLFPVESSFLDVNKTYYNAEIQSVDFSDPQIIGTINNWVKDNTNGLIEEIVQSIDPQTVMYLINAIYFNGEWTYSFDPEHTRQDTFYRSNGSTVQAEMMRMQDPAEMQLAVGEDYQAVNLFYGDAGFAMTLVLPDEGISLDQWIQQLDEDQWNSITSTFQETELTLEVPKFEMDYEIDAFADVLREMGITHAFKPALSNFSRINPNHEDLYISDTRHKTFITVDEEGTEAAAVTSIEISLTSANPPGRHIRFNRPFFYVIREVESDAILFQGVMNDPTDD